MISPNDIDRLYDAYLLDTTNNQPHFVAGCLELAKQQLFEVEPQDCEDVAIDCALPALKDPPSNCLSATGSSRLSTARRLVTSVTCDVSTTSPAS
jgi:hypothetical protein